VAAPSVYLQGLPHVDLCGLASALGGTCRVRPTQVQVDLGGKTALAGINDVQIYGSQNPFALRHPVVRHEDGIYVELLDAQTLFTQAFAVSLAPSGTSARPRTEEPPDPPNRAAVAAASPNLAEEELLGALEPLDNELFRPAQPTEPEPDPSLFEPVVPAAPASGAFDRLILDPGHGGRDAGYVGERGTTEKDVALAIALALQRALQETTDIRVLLTREEDKEASARMRATFANAQEGDLLLSIHTGASPFAQAHGIVAFYPPALDVTATALARTRTNSSLSQINEETARSHESQRLAEAIVSGLEAHTGTEARGVRQSPLQMADQSSMPTVLLEVGFLSNPAEEALLATEAYVQKLAAGIAAGIAQAAGAPSP
jgi:N-acetylmuramoyl-L-alanine amidase